MGLMGRNTRKAKLMLKKVSKGKMIMKNGPNFSPTSVLQSTEKAANAALLIQERCNACHGKTVRDVIGSMCSQDGKKYSMADLRYDIKHGRLNVLGAGKSAGPMPVGKARKAAPLFGKPLPPANMQEFFRFLQCQLKMETKEHTGNDVELKDKAAIAMWPDVQAFVTPNLGQTERWVPYHTILGVHELFLVEAVHSNKKWDEKKKFVAMFIFRAHCKRDLFMKAQLPLMEKADFWKDPAKAFRPGGPMEKAILSYRKKTGKPLLTSCFRIIPERILKDDTENLVRSITNRTMNLIDVAYKSFPIVKDPKKDASEKMYHLSNLVREAPGAGDTWAKMLTVCIDLAYPKMRMLETQCDVGTGAVKPLEVLLGDFDPSASTSKTRQAALKKLQKNFNNAKFDSAKHFWDVLKKVEGQVRAKFNHPLVLAQANTKPNSLSAVTLQVQLCEYRQFRHSIARNKYGLPEDESMRGDDNGGSCRLHAEDFIEIDKAKKCVKFDFPHEGKKIPFEVPLKIVGGNASVGKRVASLCFKQFVDGQSKESIVKFRDNLVKGYIGGPDAKPDSEAWEACRGTLAHTSPLCSFQLEQKNGQKIAFQTTMAACGGHILEAERIARLCYEKLANGMSKEKVLEYRNKVLYPQFPTPAYKKRKTEE